MHMMICRKRKKVEEEAKEEEEELLDSDMTEEDEEMNFKGTIKCLVLPHVKSLFRATTWGVPCMTAVVACCCILFGLSLKQSCSCQQLERKEKIYAVRHVLQEAMDRPMLSQSFYEGDILSTVCKHLF